MVVSSLQLTQIEAVVPGRHWESFQRLPYWILLFRNPSRATSYQSRLREYHQHAQDNLPINPLEAALKPSRGLTPPPGYVDPDTGLDVWRLLREYCLLQPAQRFSVTAMLPEFPASVQRAIEHDERWNELCGGRGSSVFVRVRGGQCGKEDICRFFEEDGKARSRPWDVIYHQADESFHQDETALFTQDSEKQSESFGIKFHSEGEAMRFWRTWHRRPCPLLAEQTSSPDADAPCLHVELTW